MRTSFYSWFLNFQIDPSDSQGVVRNLVTFGGVEVYEVQNCTGKERMGIRFEVTPILSFSLMDLVVPF